MTNIGRTIYVFETFRDLNEASLLWNLKIRYDKELIYVSKIDYVQFPVKTSFRNYVDLHRKYTDSGESLQNVRHLRS